MTNDQLLTEAERYQLDDDDYWRPKVRRARFAAAIDRFTIGAAILAALVAVALIPSALAWFDQAEVFRASLPEAESP